MKKRYKLALNLFDEGAAGAGASAQAAPAAEGQASGVSAEPTQQAGQAAGAAAEPTPEQLRSEFDELIKGKYKSLYDENVQKILKDRFKKYDGIEKTNKQMQKTISLMGQRYGTEDAAELYEKISNDASLFSDAALEAGMSEQAFLEKSRVEFENKQLKGELDRREQEEKNREIFRQWHESEIALKQSFPNFSLEKELQNESFAKLITDGIDMKTAYMVIHNDEMIAQAQQQTAAAIAAKQQTANIPKRPSENTSSQSGFQTRIDVTKLTAKERRELAQRARREKISFS